jgi:hypothetical protein
MAFAGSLPTIVVDSGRLSPSPIAKTASLEVWVQSNGAIPADLAGFQLKASVVGPDDLVQFLGVSAPTVHPYLFEPTSQMPSGLVAGNGLSVELGDFLNTGTAPLDDGVGLANLLLDVQPGAVGNYQIEVSLEATDSFLAESLTQFVNFTVQNGELVVIPEPSALSLALLGLGVGCRLRAQR